MDQTITPTSPKEFLEALNINELSGPVREYIERELLGDPDIGLLKEDSPEFIEVKGLIEENFPKALPSTDGALSKKDYADAISGLQVMASTLKGKEKQEYQDAIDGLKIVMDMTPTAAKKPAQPTVGIDNPWGIVAMLTSGESKTVDRFESRRLARKGHHKFKADPEGYTSSWPEPLKPAGFTSSKISNDPALMGLLAEHGARTSAGYSGKSAQEVWKDWSGGQRLHFLTDHISDSTPATLEARSKKAYPFLPAKAKRKLEEHIYQGQYSHGGRSGDESKNWVIVDDKNVVVEDDLTQFQAETTFTTRYADEGEYYLQELEPLDAYRQSLEKELQKHFEIGVNDTVYSDDSILLAALNSKQSPHDLAKEVGEKFGLDDDISTKQYRVSINYQTPDGEAGTADIVVEASNEEEATNKAHAEFKAGTEYMKINGGDVTEVSFMARGGKFKVPANYKKALVSENHIYYVDPEEGDESGSTVMVSRIDGSLTSDNYMASASLADVIADNDYGWVSAGMKYNITEMKKEAERFALSGKLFGQDQFREAGDKLAQSLHEALGGNKEKIHNRVTELDITENSVNMGDPAVAAIARHVSDKQNQYSPEHISNTINVILDGPIYLKDYLKKGGRTDYDAKCPVGTVLQTILFDKDKFSKLQAKSWAKSHGKKYGTVLQSKNYWRVRQKPSTSFIKNSIKTITFTDGIKATVGCPR